LSDRFLQRAGDAVFEELVQGREHPTQKITEEGRVAQQVRFHARVQTLF
jgi:hypothetical protein